jgi:ubiquinone/menaquinone biosynthesis C-methylase UbiE
VDLLRADVLELPFKDSTFDLVVFSVVLPYIKDQQKAVNEMARVTQKGGIVLATGEPDYSGALYYPENRAFLPFLKYHEDMGFDICTGRKLKYLFRKAGLKPEIGVCDCMLHFVNMDEQEQLKDYLDHFLEDKHILLKVGWTETQIEDYKQESIDLIQNGLSFFFVPAFYAIGRK